LTVLTKYIKYKQESFSASFICSIVYDVEVLLMALYKVEICGVNTAKLPLLKNDEKKELFERILKGDKEARDLYIRGNLRLVLSIIQRFSNSNENVDDLFQIGCIGLMKAIDNFDITQNVKFSTYAVPMIIGEIRRYLRDNNSIRVSRSLRDTAYKAIYTKEALMKKNDKEPTVCEIAQEIGISKEDIVFALDAIQSPVSLYEPVYSEGGDALYIMDQISDKKNKEDNWIEEIALKEAMSKLSDRENNIIKLRFFDGKTQMEVANEIQISQAQVSRLEKSALKNMRNYLLGR
jgi:RNA polymerase sporulation-specific sigma factor